MTRKAWLGGALMACTCATHAQVTLYGLLDMGPNYVSNAGGAALVEMRSGMLQQSRFGFKGTENLGGGYEAGFILESGFSADTGLLDGGASSWAIALLAQRFCDCYVDCRAGERQGSSTPEASVDHDLNWAQRDRREEPQLGLVRKRPTSRKGGDQLGCLRRTPDPPYSVLSQLRRSNKADTRLSGVYHRSDEHLASVTKLDRKAKQLPQTVAPA